MKLPIRTDEYCVDGTMPKLYVSDDIMVLKRSIEDSITEYLQNGYAMKDIVILTLNSEDNSILNGIEYIGKYKLTSELKNENEILFTTSKKYKGLESNIVMLVDFNSSVISTEEQTRLFYVSTSRARQVLDIFYYNVDDDLKLLANKMDGNQNDFIKISKFFKVMIEEIM